MRHSPNASASPSVTDAGHSGLAAGQSSNRRGTIREMTAFRLYNAWSSANPIFTRLCEGRFNITRREWRILATLVHHARLTSSELAAETGLDAARTSRAITALCAKNWLERERSSHDARTVYVAATPAGRGLYREMMPAIVELNRQITQDLSPQEVNTLHGLLERLADRARLLHGSDLVATRAHRGPGRAARGQAK